jgi:hypothetical protein
MTLREIEMRTDDLIDALSADLTPSTRYHVLRILALGFGIGVLSTFILLRITLKLRPDLTDAIAGPNFWMKFFYTAALAGLGLWIVARQARAGVNSRLPIWLTILPISSLALIAVWQLFLPGVDRHHLIMGDTARVCSLLILMLSLPLFVGIFGALRRLAPTRLELAGASAGLVSGSTAATLYGFHCPETAAPFILVWYSLGIAAAAGLGAALGRWVLRW